MARLSTIASQCRTIRETGITKDMSPETAKHIRFYNMWAVAVSLLTLLLVLMVIISSGTIRPVAVVVLLYVFLLPFGLILNKFHKYTLARVYGAVLTYAVPMLSRVRRVR